MQLFILFYNSITPSAPQRQRATDNKSGPLGQLGFSLFLVPDEQVEPLAFHLALGELHNSVQAHHAYFYGWFAKSVNGSMFSL